MSARLDYLAAAPQRLDSEQAAGKEAVDLTLAIVNMNAWNRMAIGFHKPVPARNK